MLELFDKLFLAREISDCGKRVILEEWALETINNPNEKKSGDDGNTHYFKPIPERENRVLHVVVNETVEPNRIVTLFLDKRARRTK